MSRVSATRTLERRPDLLERVSLDADEEALLEELKSLNKEMER